jgi:hypothetical protein
MDIKPIKSEEDYNKAIQRIEKLWGAKKNGKEGMVKSLYKGLKIPAEILLA